MYRLPLFAIRVVDLTEGLAAYAGRLLGDMGAEVIKVEPPAGDTLRGSDAFQRLNANKLGCALDLSTESGRDILERLAEQSDVLIAPRGFDTAAFAERYPALVVVHAANDLTSGVAAAAAVGLALWNRRRSGTGGDITLPEQVGRAIPATGSAATESISTLDGVVDLESPTWCLTESPAHIRLPAPALGEHNTYVFEHLGLLGQELAALTPAP